MSLGENIKNAFSVVSKTYENVDKLLKHCDYLAEDNGYESVTSKFLRYKSDSNYRGWYIDSFIKLYQAKEDRILKNKWKDGPVYVMEINFEDVPTIYLSKFEYEDIKSWEQGVSPTDCWGFREPVDCEGTGFKEKPIDGQEGYFISEPTKEIKGGYWGVERVVYTTIDLLEVDSINIASKIFGEFHKLKDL